MSISKIHILNINFQLQPFPFEELPQEVQVLVIVRALQNGVNPTVLAAVSPHIKRITETAAVRILNDIADQVPMGLLSLNTVTDLIPKGANFDAEAVSIGLLERIRNVVEKGVLNWGLNLSLPDDIPLNPYYLKELQYNAENQIAVSFCSIS